VVALSPCRLVGDRLMPTVAVASRLKLGFESLKEFVIDDYRGGQGARERYRRMMRREGVDNGRGGALENDEE
jgi:hypothetical protein